MHQERSVRNVYYLNTIDVADGFYYLFVVSFARGIYRDVADQVILADTYYIDTLNVAAGLPDGSRYLTELARLVVDPNSQREAVACIRRRLMAHTKAENYGKQVFLRNKKYDEKAELRQIQ